VSVPATEGQLIQLATHVQSRSK